MRRTADREEMQTVEENRQYRYFAFISYSRKDERWAKWLQNRLETYHLPAAVRKQHEDTPRRIAPVFRAFYRNSCTTNWTNPVF